MFAQNPEVIQPEDWAQPEKSTFTTPVFLIHDGGGTTFAYHCLDQLYRYVYGIHNPHFRTEQVFAGGLPEMGRLYSGWIRKTATQKDFPAKRRNRDGSLDILLGGWSLGGLLSMEVARQLAEDRLVRVVGILMIDTVYPGKSPGPVPSIPLESAAAPSADGDRELPDRAAAGARNRVSAQRCMREAARMVREWHIPQWDGKLSGRRPSMILLRAKKYIPLQGGRRGIAALDLRREDSTLGWGDHDEQMFVDVIDVDGHHFDVFAPERLDGMSKAIRRGLDQLDQYAQMMGFADGV